jgi:AcrR family transcriptional regulator
LELFSRFGVEKVSIKDIAKKAGVSQATIYNNFENKDALVREFVTIMVDQLVDGAKQSLASAAPFEDKIAAFVQFVSGMIAQGHASDAEQSFLSSSLDLINDPEIRTIRETAKEEMISLLLDVVREGKDQGQVNPGISEEAFTIYFTAFMDSLADPRTQLKLMANTKLVEELTSLMFGGLQ